MNVHSLRFRLIWIHSAAIALVVVCVGLIRYELVTYRSHQQFDDALKMDAESFVSRFRFEEHGFTVETEGLSSRDALAMLELEHHFVITNREGHVLWRNLHSRLVASMLKNGGLDDVLPQYTGFASATAEDGSTYRFYSLPMKTQGIPRGAIMHVGRSMEPQRVLLREFLLYYLYSVPLVLVLSMAIGWFLTVRALAPFEEITRTAEKITYENLNTQIVSDRREHEIQRLVQAFNAMVKRLDASFRQVRKFNADAAHELRTPLAILRGETEVALRSPDMPEDIRALLKSNLEEIDRLTRLVDDLLTLAEAEAGTRVLVREPVDVQALLKDVVEQMRFLASEQGIAIDLQSSADLWIHGDKLWIRRAVANLLDNALKYSKSGGRIEVAGASGDASVTIAIRDYGIGILPDDLPHIFDRLYRADPARSRTSGGAGIGLAIVKWVIDAHHGQIRVQSSPEQGTCVEIIFPRRPPAP